MANARVAVRTANVIGLTEYENHYIDERERADIALEIAEHQHWEEVRKR